MDTENWNSTLISIKQIRDTFLKGNKPESIEKGSWVIDDKSFNFFHFMTDVLSRISMIENELEESIKFFEENKNFDNDLLINSKNYNFDLEVNNDGLINFPSKIHNTSFQGCHIIRKNSLHPYPEIFNIQDFWKDCSLNEKIYGYETTVTNAHVGTKDEYLKYK